MLTGKNQFEYELKKEINTEIENLTNNLAAGLSVSDYASYKQVVGRIAGLKSALEHCETANTEISKV